MQKKLWDTMWRLKIPLKVKNFAWRACQESLRTKQNLIRRKIVVASQCSFCDYQEEDLWHALLYCHSTHLFLVQRIPVLQNKTFQG